MNTYWTKKSLGNFFVNDWGWIPLAAIIVFALRASTLWLSRPKDSSPSIQDIGKLSGLIFLLSILIILFVIITRSTKNIIRRSRIYNKLMWISDFDFSVILSSSLRYVSVFILLSGILVAFGLNLPLFGGVFASILTIVQIMAAGIGIFKS